MSQHLIIAEHKQKEVEVLIGWDTFPPRFFLVIETTDEDSEEWENDEYIYSNLLDTNLVEGSIHYQDIGYFKRILENLGIQIPEQVFQEVLEDKKFNVGSKVVHWNLDGTKKEN